MTVSDGHATVGGMLIDREREMLEFERTRWRYPGAKDTAIHERFDVSATRYYAELNRLIDRPEALAADPLVVKRLQRQRAHRRRARSPRRAEIASPGLV